MPEGSHQPAIDRKALGIAVAIVLLGGLGITLSYRLSVTVVTAAASRPNSGAPAQEPTPTLRPTEPEDTARYAAWLVQQRKEIKGKPREDVSLRVGGWGFFRQELSPGYSWDRAALDHVGHAVTNNEKGDWYQFLSADGLDAAVALQRIAWLFRSTSIEPASAPRMAHRDKITAPTLIAKDGTIIFEGWVALWRGEFPPDMNDPRRITIKATATGAKLSIESVKDIQ
jgi:hypothetical protein